MAETRLLEETLTRSIVGGFYDSYNELGYGFLEHLYVMGLERELRARGHRVDREVAVTVRYKGEDLGSQRLDMVVDGRIVVEIKSTELLPPHAKRQIFNYLKATRLEVGLLLHYGPKPKFHRVICSNTSARSVQIRRMAVPNVLSGQPVQRL